MGSAERTLAASEFQSRKGQKGFLRSLHGESPTCSPYLNSWNLRNLRPLLIRSSAPSSENLKKFSLNPVEGIK